MVRYLFNNKQIKKRRQAGEQAGRMPHRQEQTGREQTGRGADRQRSGQAEEQTGRGADRQSSRQAEEQTGRGADTQRSRQEEEKTG